MTSEHEAEKMPHKGATGKLESRLVFVSHTHTDRELAQGLKSLIETAFSGTVRTFVSTDPGPTGGIMPGGEGWYSQIEANLKEAEAVWVLATPASITRPWIYWEAGTGKALCPSGVVVIRVGLGVSEVPSPLNNFQSYDGLSAGGVNELVGKVAGQIGMNLAPVLLEHSGSAWLEVANGYEPLTEAADQQQPELSPERLDRLDGAIARMEALSVAGAGRAGGALPSDIQAAGARAASLEVDRQFVVGAPTLIYGLGDLVAAVEGTPPDATFEATGIDGDGDAFIRATRDGRMAMIFLKRSALEAVESVSDTSPRTQALMKAIAEIRDAAAS